MGGESSIGDALQVVVGLHVFLERLAAVINKHASVDGHEQAVGATGGGDPPRDGEGVDGN